jgi:hypothetical protein
MNIAVSPAALAPAPIEVDPRPCTLCGLTVDRHVTFDDGERSEFFCPDPAILTLDELERRAELVRQIEVAAIVREMELDDPRDRWHHTGDKAPSAEVRSGPRRPAAPVVKSYRTPQATIDAFWHVTRLDDPEYLKRWLAQHPRDVTCLQKLWEAKHAIAQ